MARPQRSGFRPRTKTICSSVRMSCRISSAVMSRRLSRRGFHFRWKLLVPREGLAPADALRVASRPRNDAVLAAGLRDRSAARSVRDRAVGTPGDALEPGGLAVLAPLLDELTFGLVDEDEGDAVLAAGIAGPHQRSHEAEAGDLVEEEEYAVLDPTIGLVDGIEQGTDDAATERRRGFQDLQVEIEEQVEPAGAELTGRKRLARNELRKTRIGEPLGLFAHVAVDAREGLVDQLLQLPGEVAGPWARELP